MWQNLKISNCDKYQKTQILKKLKKKCDKTKKLKLCQNSKTEIDTKLKKSNVYKTQKLELRQNSKTQIVTVLFSDSSDSSKSDISKNNLIPQQPMRCS